MSKAKSFSSYTHANTLNFVGEAIEEVVRSLQESSQKLCQWLYNNQVKDNPSKCCLITIKKKLQKLTSETHLSKAARVLNFLVLKSTLLFFLLTKLKQQQARKLITNKEHQSKSHQWDAFKSEYRWIQYTVREWIIKNKRLTWKMFSVITN